MLKFKLSLVDTKSTANYRFHFFFGKFFTYWKIFTVIVATLILFVLYSKGIIAIAFVNGEPVTLREMARIIRREEPVNYIDTLVFEKMVELEGKRRNIVVRQQEIQDEVADITMQAQTNGKTLVELLNESGQTLEDLQRNVKLRIILYKIILQDIEVTDGEIDQFIEENSELYNEGEVDVIRNEVKQILTGAKTSEKVEEFAKYVKAESEIKYLIK